MRFDPETRTRALIAYKREIAEALVFYNRYVAQVWNSYGRPSTSADCKADLDGAWSCYVALLRHASDRFNTKLGVAEMIATGRAA